MFFICFSGPRSGPEGILELLEATWELLNPRGGILDAMIALLEHHGRSWTHLEDCEPSKRGGGSPARQQRHGNRPRGGFGEGINPSPQGLEEKRD